MTGVLEHKSVTTFVLRADHDIILATRVKGWLLMVV